MPATVLASRAIEAALERANTKPDEVNEVLSKVDSRTPPEEDAGPVPAVPIDAGAPGD